jgi:hypothetical protein
MSQLAIKKLTSYVRQKELTNCLDLLESYGYKGDTAVLLLAWFQVGGER